MRYKYCPVCGGNLTDAELGGRERQCCADPACGHVFWNNPVPVVAAIVEHENKIVLGRNAEWPEDMFALITGFLEADEEPEEGIVREVEEELGLKGKIVEFLGTHVFSLMNQIIFSYHVRATGKIVLDEELADYMTMSFEDAFYWPVSTGLVLKEFLEARGYQPALREMPPAMQAYVDQLEAQKAQEARR